MNAEKCPYIFPHCQIQDIMLSKRRTIVIISVSLVLGMLLGAVVFANLVSGHSILLSSGQVTKDQGLFISGTEAVKVLSPEGKVLSTWQGPDPISNLAINALAACIPGSDGGSTDPKGPDSTTGASGSCSSFTDGVYIVFAPADYPFIGGTCSQNAGAQTENGFSVTGCQANAQAVNTLTPLGCDPNSTTSGGNPALCTGWITEATFGPTTFTATNCIYSNSQTPCAVLDVGAGTLSQLSTYGTNGAFDYLNPSPIIPVSAGDSLLVTIQFTIS